MAASYTYPYPQKTIHKTGKNSAGMKMYLNLSAVNTAVHPKITQRVQWALFVVQVCFLNYHEAITPSDQI